jgi:Ca2+-binding RTX toxin-like protein
MRQTLPRLLGAAVPCALLCALPLAVAAANTSHAGWPPITGRLKMHKRDQSAPMRGTSRNDELLGGHGSDRISGRRGHDVIWGDYKPGGQPVTQYDQLSGASGNDFIYASHGTNSIAGGAGDDTIHAHFGRGTIDCGSGTDTVFVSRRGGSGWRLRGCERISHKTLGY